MQILHRVRSVNTLFTINKKSQSAVDLALVLIDAGQKNSGEIREEISPLKQSGVLFSGSAASLADRVREEVNRLLHHGAARWPLDVLNIAPMLRLHNNQFCNAAMQQKHGSLGRFLGAVRKEQAATRGPLALLAKTGMSGSNIGERICRSQKSR